jgi:hypothetical protein
VAANTSIELHMVLTSGIRFQSLFFGQPMDKWWLFGTGCRKVLEAKKLIWKTITDKIWEYLG